MDTTGSAYIRETRMTYTAAHQLAWSLTHNEPGSYSNLAATVTWHWYDAQGLRVQTEVAQTGLASASYYPLGPGSGIRTYYVYDGTDVALTLYQAPGQGVKLAKRYLTGGLDHQLAVRVLQSESGYLGALALISNRQGSVLGAMRPNGLRESSVRSYTTDAFGKVRAEDGSGTTNPEVGFAGASTGDPKGGFTYLRNRWYDPQTGRFLTQDPIGLAGGVNLYAYAGNNPIAYTDPFGLDTLDIEPEARKDVQRCRDKSATCDAAFTIMESSSVVYRVEKLGASEAFLDPNCISGCTSPQIVNNQATMQYRPSDFTGSQRRTGVKVDATIVIGHEVGHALGLTTTSSTCTDKNGCAKGFENQIRTELGKKYGQRP